MNPSGQIQERVSESPDKPSNRSVRPQYSPTKVDLDRIHLRKHGIFLDTSDDNDTQVAISAIKQLRTLVMSNARDLGVRSLLVTGPTEGIGKTSIALNLAIYLSRMHVNTLLIDLDLRGSSLLKTLGINREYGSERIGEQGFDIRLATVQIGLPNLYIVPCAERMIDSSERLCSDYATAFFKELPLRLPKNSFVIYDTPPLLGCDDVPAILSCMESVLMVVEEGRTSRREIIESRELIKPLPLLGTVMNKSRDKSIHKYYY